jgi:elongation factor Tu
VERGSIHVGDPVEIVKFGAKKLASIAGIEQSKKMKESTSAGDTVGILLGGANLGSIERGNVLATPNSIQSKSVFKAVIYWLAKEEGGRHMPVFNGFAAQFQLRTATIKGTLSLPAGVQMAMPGSSGEVTVKLDVPVALNPGLQFSVREGTRVIAHGLLTVPVS